LAKKKIKKNKKEEKEKEEEKEEEEEDEDEIDDNNTGGFNTKKWKFDLLSPNCKINQKGKSCSHTTNSGYDLAIISKGSKIKKGKANFSFKIIQDPSNWIGVGVAKETKVKSKDFTWNTSGHNTYIWTSNGYNWDDAGSGISNSKSYTANEIIDCEVDCKKKVITMTKRSNGDTVTMTISSFPVYPCALFYYNGEIQIEKFKKRKKR